MIEIQNTDNSTSSCDVQQNDHPKSSGMLTDTNEAFHQNVHNTLDESQDTVPCQGLFDRKFEILYGDGNAGATTAQKLWANKCQEESDGIICTPEDQKVVVTCDCCTGYTDWKNKHQHAAKLLQKVADIPCYYKISEEQIAVGKETYKNTICALHSAPRGVCKGTAFKSGPHPYTCDACDAL